MADWTEIERADGAWEIGDANNSIYVATEEEAIAVALSWYPDAERQPHPETVADTIHNARAWGYGSRAAAVCGYLGHLWGEDAPFASIVMDDESAQRADDTPEVARYREALKAYKEGAAS